MRINDVICVPILHHTWTILPKIWLLRHTGILPVYRPCLWRVQQHRLKGARHWEVTWLLLIWTVRVTWLYAQKSWHRALGCGLSSRNDSWLSLGRRSSLSRPSTLKRQLFVIFGLPSLSTQSCPGRELPRARLNNRCVGMTTAAYSV